MLVLLVPVFLLVLGYRVLLHGDAPIAVDPSDTITAARHDAKFPILVPAGLPATWTVSSATFRLEPTGSVLRLGYLAGDHAGLQLVESDEPVDQFLPGELGSNAQPGDLVAIGGQQWRTYPSVRGGARALVLAQDRGTVVIVGSGGDDDLRTLAASLH